MKFKWYGPVLFSVVVCAASAQTLIFEDGFESNNTSAWSSTVPRGNSLFVHSGAALEGNFGLEVTLVLGSTSSTYVQDLSPDMEASMRAEFLLDPQFLAIGAGESFVLYRAGFVGGTAVRVTLMGSDTGLLLSVSGMDHIGTEFQSPWVPLGNGEQLIGVGFSSGTAPGAFDGHVRLTIDGALKTGVTCLDNDMLRIDFQRLGANSVAVGMSGVSFYLDAFRSHSDEMMIETNPDWTDWPAETVAFLIDRLAFGYVICRH